LHFFVCFCFTQTIVKEIFQKHFLTLLNIPARKIFCAKYVREAFGPLVYTPEVTPMGLFANYPPFLPDVDET
jgi:hypothetical protein